MGLMTNNQTLKSARPDCRGAGSSSFLVKGTKSPLLAHIMDVIATMLMKFNKARLCFFPRPPPCPHPACCSHESLPTGLPASQSQDGAAGVRMVEAGQLDLPSWVSCPPLSTSVPACFVLGSCGQTRSYPYFSPHNCILQTGSQGSEWLASQGVRVETHLTWKPMFSVPAGHLSPGPAALMFLHQTDPEGVVNVDPWTLLSELLLQ